jgi:hypothetical protein
MQRARVFLSLAAAGLVVAAFAPQAGALPAANDGPAVLASGASPIAGCDGDPGGRGLPGEMNFTHSEVEPWMAVNPANPSNLIAAWQQDRWSSGGSEGLVTASSFDGGLSWIRNANTKSSFCTGGTAANRGAYERASDPWVDFSSDGRTAYLMSLSVNTNPGGFGLYPNAMLVMRSTNGGATWSKPITLRRDEDSSVLNDKNTLTADANDPSVAYAVWDRLVSPPGEQAAPIATENAIGYRGPTWFSRTTDGGASWETARSIYDPGTVNQTIGNQIVVLPDNDQFDGELVNFFDLIQNFGNRQPGRGLTVALIRSDDQGATWDPKATIVDRHNAFQGMVVDPDDPNTTTRLVRTGDIIPQGTVDPNTGAIYLVFQDMRFGPRSSIAFTQSRDGGQTWSPTIKINKTPTDIALGNQQAFNPVVSVLDDGTIGVRYSDFRANQATPQVDVLATDEFLVHCHPSTPTACADPDNWGDEVKQTDTSYNIRQMPFAGGWFPGDYVGMDTDGADWLPFWAQPSGGDPANDFVRRVGLVVPPG